MTYHKDKVYKHKNKNKTNKQTNWCNLRTISVLLLLAAPGTSGDSVFSLPQEFTSVAIAVVYIPPHADTDTALASLHNTINKHPIKHLDTALVSPAIMAGDFNTNEVLES